MHDDQKGVHPFFVKGSAPVAKQADQPETKPITDYGYAAVESTEPSLLTVDHEMDMPQLDGSNDLDNPTANAKKGRGKGRGKTKTSPATKKAATKQTDQADETVEAQSDIRRKRRRISQDAAADVGLQIQVPASSPPLHPVDVEMGGQGSEDFIVHDSSQPQLPSSQQDSLPLQSTPTQHDFRPTLVPHPHQVTDVDTPKDDSRPTTADTGPLPTTASKDDSRPTTAVTGPLPTFTSKDAPKKMLQLKAGGRLASPTKTAPAKEPAKAKRTSKRGKGKKGKQLLVVCRYSQHEDIGLKIDRILDGEERYHLPPTVSIPPQAAIRPTKPAKPAKPTVQKHTHPFFSGKPKPPSSMPPPPTASIDHTQTPRKTSAVTPGKLRAQRQSQRMQDEDYDSAPPPFGQNRDRNISKQPGMTHAPWPSKGLAHVRGDFYYHTRYHSDDPSSTQPPLVNLSLSRKMKQTIAFIDPGQDLLDHCRQHLDFHQEDRLRRDGFSDPPPSLRLPTRSLIPGSKIQSLVYDQLGESSSMHPACVSIYDSLPQALTPYDEGRSEVQAWAQKYAPTSADLVLQPGKEATILRDWMKALTIMSVEGSTSFPVKPSKPDLKPKKKRRKKNEDLEGFVVNSDEDLTCMNELSEPDDNISSQNSRPAKRSLVQTKVGGSKLSNAILISGPSGCGKSAMVHAVAKELGFEIFEINSGSRRSGKDVLDRVGDMVENHLVQRHTADTGNTSADEDAGRLSEAFEKDLESGRQGTMGSFFKAKSMKPQPVKKQEPNIQPDKKVQAVQQTMTKSKTPRSQKQSLIFLEEIDVLYEEDKGFWQTIFTLIINSKRPVIMTCNDEDLVPIQAMTLHAMLRLSPPPVDVATDYLLLMAAKEGHLVSRSAVATLYESKRCDLRASIAGLQLWCQMGVGDPRGGLGWIFQRWPEGTGVDEHGQPIRVASEGTYQSGMGAVTFDPEPSLQSSSEEASLQQLWEDWGVDPRTELFEGVEHDAETCVFADKESRMKALQDHERFTATMSDVDMFSRIGIPNNTIFDISEPEISDKARSHYISGMRVLQTPPLLDYKSIDTRLAVACSHLVSHVYNHPINISTSASLIKITADNSSQPLARADFAQALEPLAYPPATTVFSQTPSMSYTSLDGPFKPIALDIAPYVRFIAGFDLELEAQRAKMVGNEGPGRKIRTTRAARSALEGGQRALTRRERWFGDSALDLEMVLKTGGEWPKWIESGYQDLEVDKMEVEE